MKRTIRWFVGVIALTAATLITLQGWGLGWTALAQAPSPTPATTAPVAPPPPTASPAGATSPTPAPTPTTELYKDPGDRFQLGVLEGYTQSVVAGIPLFESPTGDIAYTVLVRSRANTAKVNEAALAQIAIDALAQGEGFAPGSFEAIASGGATVPWAGQLTIKGPPQSMKGFLISRQVDNRILILAIAATQAGEAELSTVYSRLEPTFTAPQPA